MKLVIDIDEKTYASLIRAKEKCPSALTLIEWNISNGTPLPKVLGDIKKEVEKEREWLLDTEYNAYNIDVAFNSIIHKLKKLGE